VQNDASGPRGNGMKWSTFGVRWPKIKVHRAKIHCKNHFRPNLKTVQQTLTKHGWHISQQLTTTRMQKVKGQGHTRQIQRPGRGIIFYPFGLSGFSNVNTADFLQEYAW